VLTSSKPPVEIQALGKRVESVRLVRPPLTRKVPLLDQHRPYRVYGKERYQRNSDGPAHFTRDRFDAAHL
jgi:hypothetical protein